MHFIVIFQTQLQEENFQVQTADKLLFSGSLNFV
jgi:hypothetical protein